MANAHTVEITAPGQEEAALILRGKVGQVDPIMEVYDSTGAKKPIIRADGTLVIPVGGGTSEFPWLNVKDYGAVGDGVANDTAAIQAALNDADSLGASGTKVPNVILPPGIYSINATLLVNRPGLMGQHPNSSTRIVWNGAAGGTMLAKGAGYNTSFGEISNINFRAGSAEPATFIDLTGATNSLDKFLILRMLHFISCTGDAIKIGTWVNQHWEHLRWDGIGGYAIRVTTTGGMSGDNFVLDKFTFDHSRASGNGKGFLYIDNLAGGGGQITIQHGRVEVNTAWVNPQAFIHWRVPDVSPPSQLVSVVIEDVQFAGSAAGAEVFAYRETAASTGDESLTLKNVSMSSTSALFGGTWPSTKYLLPPSNYGLLVYNTNGSGSAAPHDIVTQRLGLYADNAQQPITMRRAGDTGVRWRLAGSGTQEWAAGDGSAVDTNLYRGGANLLKTDDGFRALNIITGSGANEIDIWDDGYIYFANTGDTNLHRVSAGVLKTDAAFQVGTTLSVGGVPISTFPWFDVDAYTGTDDQKIEAALTAATTAGGGTIRFSRRSTPYTFNDPHTIGLSNITIRGEPGTVIQIGAAPTGVLATNGRVFTVGAQTNVRFEGLKLIGPAAGTLTVSSTNSAFIYIASSGAANIQIVDCIFDTNGHMANQDAIINSGALYTKILRNQCTACGIVYASNDASYAVCADNVVLQARSNGLTGSGNGAGYSLHCVVRNNTVIDAVRMGIEDGAKTKYTQFIGNYVINPGTGSNKMGISAVGHESLVQGNTLLDCGLYGIEQGGRSGRVVDNVIRNSSYIGGSIGIGCNNGDLDLDGAGGSIISNNVVENHTVGVQIVNNSGPVNIVGNQLINNLYSINTDTTNTKSSIVISDNIIRFTIASQVAGRIAIRLQPTGFNSNSTRVIGNNIVWETTAGGGAHAANEEMAMLLNGSNVMVAFNRIDANNCVDASAHPVGRIAATASSPNCIFFGNMCFNGVYVDLTNLTNCNYGYNNILPTTAGTNIRWGVLAKQNAPAAMTSAYTVTNSTPDRTYDANATTVAELAQVVAALIADLKTYGVVV